MHSKPDLSFLLISTIKRKKYCLNTKSAAQMFYLITCSTFSLANKYMLII